MILELVKAWVNLVGSFHPASCLPGGSKWFGGCEPLVKQQTQER